MLFPESDAPLLKAWIVKRLANTSDADADVLADYVLALLRHDGHVDTIRELFEQEIPDFLREDASAFTSDVFQAVKYRSYIPGAPPPPPPTVSRRQQPPTQPMPFTQPHPHPGPPRSQSSYGPPSAFPTFNQGGSRKRAHNEVEDNDVDIILSNESSYPGPPTNKFPRRGGAFPRHGGRYDEGNRFFNQRGGPGPYAPPSGPSHFTPLPQFPPPHGSGLHQIDPNAIIENIHMLQQLLPQPVDLPKPVYSGMVSTPSRRKRGRCRDYDTKGYCSRGSNCLYEHGSESVYMPPFVPPPSDEYDPNNATLAFPFFSNEAPPPLQALQPLDTAPIKGESPGERRESNRPRRIKGRPLFAANGPMRDKSNITIVVQNIPSQHFSEDAIRDYFSQFGAVDEVTMQRQNFIAIVKFDTWESANAAYTSPKVIFDNRFVKVYWHKDEAEAGSTPNGKHIKLKKDDASNGRASTEEKALVEPDFDMEEFKRKQEEAQKIHQEKTQKREEIERERAKLQERQKELIARQIEEKRKLQAKLAAKNTPNGSSSLTVNGDDTTKKPSTQTEALRAQLAALEAEANVLGIDPDAQDEAASWTPRGRGRGRGYRGRGSFSPGLIRGSSGYRGRGGGGIEARHAAYAAFSLDNRPKTIKLSGADFTMLEKDEALRQYLFSIGEFSDIVAEPTTTSIVFKDRKTAEKFMFGASGNNLIPGIDDKIELAWDTTAITPQTNPTSTARVAANGDTLMISGLEDERAVKEDKASIAGSSGLEEGEVQSINGDHDQGDMDYEANEAW